MRRRRGLIITAVSVAALLGCGRADGPRSEPSSTSLTGRFAAEIGSVSAGEDGRSLVARIDVLPVEGSTGDCAVDVAGTVELDGDVVDLGVTFQSRVAGPDPAFPACDTAPRAVVVDVGAPLAGRHVVTRTPAARWRPTDDGRYERCQLPSCDPATGTEPVPATCDDSTLADAVRAGDVPRHTGLAHERCELPWAVVDLDVGAGACPVGGDGPNPCAGQQVRRTYWKAAGYTWEQVGSSTGAGCGDVAAIVADFPLRLCADLPPLP